MDIESGTSVKGEKTKKLIQPFVNLLGVPPLTRVTRSRCLDDSPPYMWCIASFA